MASTASLLFKELNQRMENLAEKFNKCSEIDDRQLSTDLYEWKRQYDLVFQLTNQIKHFFGPILFITYAADYAVAFLEFQNIMNFEGGGISPRYYLQFIHICLRLLLIFIVSNRVETKVCEHYKKIFRNAKPHFLVFHDRDLT